jgi:hypothetical protein
VTLPVILRAVAGSSLAKARPGGGGFCDFASLRAE